MKYPKLPNAVFRYGASMGRNNSVMEPSFAIQFRLYRMPMTRDGCYDSGGAYWGAGNDKTGFMYHAYGDGPKYVNEVFVRAKTRAEAKEKVRIYFPHATFYR